MATSATALIYPAELKKAGYSDDEIAFVNESHKQGHSSADIDRFLSDFKKVQPPGPVDQNAINRASLIKSAPSHQIVDPRGTPSSYLTNPSDTTIDVARPIVSGFAGDVAGTAAAPIPIPGSSIGAYTGTYSVVDALLQYLKKDKPSSIGSALGEGAGQALSGKILSGLLNRVGAGAKALHLADQPAKDLSLFSMEPTTSQALKGAGSTFLAGGSKLLEDLNTTAKEAALDNSAGKGFTAALRLANQSEFSRLDNGRINFSMNPNKMLEKVNSQLGPSGPNLFEVSPPFQTLKELDNIIQDPVKLEKVLSRAQANGVSSNVRKTLASYQFSQIFNRASVLPTDGRGMRLDPNEINKIWNDPEMQDSLKKLYNRPTRDAMDQLFKNITITQDKMGPSPSNVRYWLTRGGIGIAAGVITGSLSGNAAMSGIATSGVFITAGQLGKLLSNPTTARVMVALAGKEPLGISEQFAGKLIIRALQGSTVALINQDGSKTPAQIDKDGRLNPLQ